MGVFLEVDGLAELERREEWEKARRLLYRLWEQDRMNVRRLCRLSAECWCVLCEWDCWTHKPDLSPEPFKNTLIEATEFGIRHFSRDITFLWLSGYMISQFPYLFDHEHSDQSFSTWESTGKHMLRTAAGLKPDDVIASILYLGSSPGHTEAYRTERVRFQPFLDDAFPGDTLIEAYFRDILNEPSGEYDEAY